MFNNKKLLFIAVSLLALKSGAQTRLLFARTNAPFFDFIMQGDLHAGGPASAYLRLYDFTNSINTILASNTAGEWNVKLYISPGDMFDGFTQVSLSNSCSILQMTQQLYRLKAANISVLPCPGNHDADSPGDTNFWNTYFSTNFFTGEPMFVSNRFVGDTKETIFTYTNGALKFVFVTWRWNTNVMSSHEEVMTNYNPATMWVSNIARAYYNHHFVGVMHYFLNTRAVPAFADKPDDEPPQGYDFIGPGYEAWSEGFYYWSNSLYALSGHVRQTIYNTTNLMCFDGHMLRAIKYNTQGHYNGMSDNGGSFVHFRVYPTEGYIRTRVYDIALGRFVTNGELPSVFIDPSDIKTYLKTLRP